MPLLFGPVVPPPSPAGSRSSGTCRLLMFRCVARYVTRTTPPLRRPPRLFERASLNPLFLCLSLASAANFRFTGRSSARTTRQTWLTSAPGIRSWQERLRMDKRDAFNACEMQLDGSLTLRKRLARPIRCSSQVSILGGV